MSTRFHASKVSALPGLDFLCRCTGHLSSSATYFYGHDVIMADRCVEKTLRMYGWKTCILLRYPLVCSRSILRVGRTLAPDNLNDMNCVSHSYIHFFSSCLAWESGCVLCDICTCTIINAVALRLDTGRPLSRLPTHIFVAFITLAFFFTSFTVAFRVFLSHL